MTDYLNEFTKCLNSIKSNKRNYDVFQDFLTCSTLSLANTLLNDESIENEYLEIIKQYSKPERLADLLGITVLALEQKYHDFLGQVYMLNKFENKNSGQFFTPYHISQFMSECTFDDKSVQEIINQNKYITVSDPCCGAGGMIIAFADTMLQHGFNPQKQMIFQGIDIDDTCCKMSYIQTSLLGLTGEIAHGDSITYKFWKYYTTPMTILNLDKYHHFKDKIKEPINNTYEEPRKEVLFSSNKTVQLKLL